MASEREIRQRLVDELQRIGEDSLYSAKSHFNAANGWGKVNYWLGIPAAVMSGLAGASALSQFDNHNIIAGALALVVAAITAVGTFLNPSEQSVTHQGFGNKFNSLKNRCRVATDIDSRHLTIDELRQKVDDLGDERDELNAGSPGIPRWAFERARRGIEEGEAEYKVDQGA